MEGDTLRISLARNVGPIFWPAWYLAPKWKRDKWHRIACDDPCCPDCAEHYHNQELAFKEHYPDAYEEVYGNMPECEHGLRSSCQWCHGPDYDEDD